MNVPCRIISEIYIPEIRAKLAKEMVSRGVPQKKIASYLGVSQGMVSRYLMDDGDECSDFSKGVVTDSLRVIERGSNQVELIKMFCKRCLEHRESGRLCPSHGLDGCSVCFNLRTSETIGDRLIVLEDLSDAFHFLKGRVHPWVVPEVKINMAMSLRRPKGPTDVAAFPGRLTYLKGELRHLGPPEFGASKHLAAILLTSTEVRPVWRSVIAIANNESVLRAMDSTGLKYQEVQRRVELLNGIRGLLRQNIYDCIMDRGDFGIEPCAYVFGESAMDAARKTVSISSKVAEDESGLIELQPL